MHQKKHLFKSPSQQEKAEGDTGHENSNPLENPHFIDSEGTDQKDNVQTVVDNVLWMEILGKKTFENTSWWGVFFLFCFVFFS